MKDIPSDFTIRSTYDKFLETGTVVDRPRSGRPCSSVNEENAEKIQEVLDDSADFFSIDDMAEILEISHGSTHTLLRKTLHYVPYKIQCYQRLFDEDFHNRALACEEILKKAAEVDGFFNKLITSDESTFHVNGVVNRHNCRIWGSQKPEPLSIKEHSSPKVNVWVGLSHSKIYGPYFFPSDTVKSEDYLLMLKDFFVPMLKNHHKFKSSWFQQDGAPPHWSLAVRAFLNENFPNRWIGRGGALTWPARSPDLAPPDFFLWGHIKNNVYKRRPKNVQELKAFIVHECDNITVEQLENVMSAFHERLNRCVQTCGHSCEK
jgi:hypothetical protein